MLDELKRAIGKRTLIAFTDGNIQRGVLTQNIIDYKEIPEEFDLYTIEGKHVVFNCDSVKLCKSYGE